MNVWPEKKTTTTEHVGTWKVQLSGKKRNSNFKMFIFIFMINK